MIALRRLPFALLCLMAAAQPAPAQQSTALWDDTRVSAIHVTLPADSLAALFADPYADHYYTATFVFDDGAARDTVPMVGLRLRGNTSRNAAKQSFKISFNTYVPGRRYQGAKKLNLNGQHNDPTMIREKLFYETWARAGMPERRSTFVELHINGTLRGVYTCLEELDKDWLLRNYGEDSGNLYKCTYPADLDNLGTNPQAYKNVPSSTVTGGRAYDLQTNEALDDYSGFAALVTQLHAPASASFLQDLHAILDVEGFLKALALDVATGNWDDYAYNKNNFFLYQRQPSGQFSFITYDTDNTFGVDWVGRDWATRDCADWVRHGEPRPLATRLLGIPEFRSRYYAILDSITRHITAPSAIFPRIDSLEAFLAPYAARDSFRTLDYGYTLADFHLGFTGTVDGHTPYGIKPFLSQRHTSTLAQLDAVTVWPPRAEQAAFLVAPNPAAAGQAQRLVSFSSGRPDVECAVVDAAGRLIAQQSWPRGALELELPELGAGTYLLLWRSRDSRGAVVLVRG